MYTPNTTWGFLEIVAVTKGFVIWLARALLDGHQQVWALSRPEILVHAQVMWCGMASTARVQRQLLAFHRFSWMLAAAQMRAAACGTHYI